MVMYDSIWCMDLLIFETMILITGLILAIRFKFALWVGFSAKNSVIQKNKKMPIYITMRNRSILPLAGMMADIEINRENGKKEYCRINSVADGRDRVSDELMLDSGHCGVVHLKMVRAKTWDYLKFFKLRCKANGEATVIVIPEIYPATVEVLSDFRYFTGEGDTYSDSESGDDPSEVFEIRDYRSGDKMQKIHWKLSARTDHLMVKDYSDPVGFAIVIVCAFSIDAADDEQYDALMTAVFSISSQLLTDGYTHYLAWLTENGGWRRFKMYTENSIYKAMPYMIKEMSSLRQKSKHSKNEINAWMLDNEIQIQTFNERFGRASYHTMVRIDSDLNVYKNGELVSVLDVKELKHSLFNLNLEI